MHDPIITSILDSDLYKFTMQQVVFHQYPDASVKYEFKCRSNGVKLGAIAAEVREQVDSLREVELTYEEYEWMRKVMPFMREDYLDWLLDDFKFNPQLVSIKDVDGELVISIKGKWVDTILFEVPVLAIVNEVYFNRTQRLSSEVMQKGLQKLSAKIDLIKNVDGFQLAEFGTRRRRSKAWQNIVASVLFSECPNMVGTSNLLLAKRYNQTPIGTMAHEYISAHLGLVMNVGEAQKRAFHVWLQEYDTSLGVALSDTFTSDAFFKDFGSVLSNCFAGVRHDSGDPIAFGEAVIEHYKKLGIDPLTKTIVFSDGLYVESALEIFSHFNGRIKISFGIGTSLTNDLGHATLSIVIKIIECNGVGVVKLSDNLEKSVGCKEMMRKVCVEYGIMSL